jgi:hypothetical protein
MKLACSCACPQSSFSRVHNSLRHHPPTHPPTHQPPPCPPTSGGSQTCSWRRHFFTIPSNPRLLHTCAHQRWRRQRKTQAGAQAHGGGEGCGQAAGLGWGVAALPAGSAANGQQQAGADGGCKLARGGRAGKQAGGLAAHLEDIRGHWILATVALLPAHPPSRQAGSSWRGAAGDCLGDGGQRRPPAALPPPHPLHTYRTRETQQRAPLTWARPGGSAGSPACSCRGRFASGAGPAGGRQSHAGEAPRRRRAPAAAMRWRLRVGEAKQGFRGGLECWNGSMLAVL